MIRPTMPVTQDMIDSLNQAIADGVRSVQINGETVIYQTTDSLIKARDDMTIQMAAQQPASTRPPSRVTYLTYGGRGYQRGGC